MRKTLTVLLLSLTLISKSQTSISHTLIAEYTAPNCISVIGSSGLASSFTATSNIISPLSTIITKVSTEQFFIYDSLQITFTPMCNNNGSSIYLKCGNDSSSLQNIFAGVINTYTVTFKPTSLNRIEFILKNGNSLGKNIYINDIEIIAFGNGSTSVSGIKEYNVDVFKNYYYSNKLYFIGKYNNEKIIINDLIGNIVLEDEINKTINVEHLNKGLYTVSIYDKNKQLIQTKKIIIN